MHGFFFIFSSRWRSRVAKAMGVFFFSLSFRGTYRTRLQPFLSADPDPLKRGLEHACVDRGVNFESNARRTYPKRDQNEETIFFFSFFLIETTQPHVAGAGARRGRGLVARRFFFFPSFFFLTSFAPLFFSPFLFNNNEPNQKRTSDRVRVGAEAPEPRQAPRRLRRGARPRDGGACDFFPFFSC